VTSTLIVVAIGLLLFGWVLNLIRNGSVYVGYGSALLIAIAGIICIALMPVHFLEVFMYHAGNIIPRGVPLFLAIYGILLTLIYVLKEITAISRRLRNLAEQLAIELARHGSTTNSGEPVQRRGIRAGV
jgi:hypothetical protein